MLKTIFKLFIIGNLFLISGCAMPKQEEPPKEYIPQNYEEHFLQDSAFPFYLYEDETELEQIKTIEPYDATPFQGTNQEFEDGALFPYEIFVQLNNTWESYSSGEDSYLTLPNNDGTYLLCIDLGLSQTATPFIIGDGKYIRSVQLPVFEEEYYTYTEHYIVLSDDIYKSRLEVHDMNFNQDLVISKEATSEFFFNDFDYIVCDRHNESVFETVQFRNGNEIHYQDEVYYIHKVKKELNEIFTAAPTHFLDIVGDEEIIRVEVIYDQNGGYSGNKPVEIIQLTSEQHQKAKEIITNANIYKTNPLIYGAGGDYYTLQVTTNKHVYRLSDISGPLYIDNIDTDEFKGKFNACFRVRDLLKEIGFELVD